MHGSPEVTILSPALLWIPGLPLLAFVILIFIGRKLEDLAPWVGIFALAGSCALTLSLAQPVFHGARVLQRWAWLSPTNSAWNIGFMVDGLSWMMLFVVTVIGTMIQIYSIGYMHGDPRYSRFFAYLSLFCASMLTLVLADHFVLLFAGWELVGLCSYLLVSFWFEKPAAAAAGRKAFITTRIGDTGLLLGILLLFWLAGDLRFASLGMIRDQLLAQGNGTLLTLLGALIFFGAVGKSAQFPLHVWLPDAMEGPTSVSALIHAATMVAAGVYLVARTFALFTPESLTLVLAIGLTTHLIAGTIALTQTDIKRVMAYSTLSQLGLMFVAMGLGARSAALFHLFTHAFFKALLFLSAGSIIHAAHTQELPELGGLSKHMPVTRWLFLIAALSMCGVPFLSGFWSKDAILLEAGRIPWLQALLVLGAVMTTCYILRVYFRVFHGPEAQRDHARSHGKSSRHHLHESPAAMLIPMSVLGVGAAIAGFAGSPWFDNPFFHVLGDSHAHEHIDIPLLLMTLGILAVGGSLAWFVGFQRRNLLPVPLRPIGRLLYMLAYNKYYVDEIYARFIIAPIFGLSRAGAIFDARVVDGVVNGAGRLGWLLSQAKGAFDRIVVDGIVNGVAAAAQAFGSGGRSIQNGIIQHYLLITIIAVITLSWLIRR